MSAENQSTGWGALLTRAHLPRLAVMALALWLHASNSLLAATTLPSAIADIGGLNLISWAFALYLMGSITAGPCVSLLVHRFDIRGTMLRATLIFALGCAICASAPSIYLLLAGRIIQGFGGGLLVALVYICQVRFFPNRFVPRIVACMSMVWMLSALCGPLIGGAFATWGLWRMAFWAYALQALALLLAVRVMPSGDEALPVESKRIPLVRLTFLVGAILSVSLAGAYFHPLFSPLLILVGIGALAAFIYWDRRAAVNRMLPLALTRLDHRVGSGITMTFCLSLSIMSFIVYGPLILINLYGLSPLQVGFVIMLESVGWTLGAVFLSGLSPQAERYLIRSGSVLVAFGLISMAAFLPNGPLAVVIVCIMLQNVGMGMMWGYIVRRVVDSADADEKDRTSTLIPATQQLGFALGAALSGLIANGLGLSAALSPERLKVITVWLFIGFLPCALVGIVLAWKFTRQPTTVAQAESGGVL